MEYLTDTEIGEIIRERREKMGLTQKQLGERLGVQAAAVNKWELGKVVNIKREVLQQLSVVLKIHPATLIGFKLYDFTEQELIEIRQYVSFIKSKRG